MLLMVLFVSSAAFSQIVDKNGASLKLVQPVFYDTLDNRELGVSELVQIYKYLVELQNVRSNYKVELKKNDYLNQQVSAYQNQLALKDDMNENLQAYAEQVKAKWYQSEYAIILYVVVAVVITYAVAN